MVLQLRGTLTNVTTDYDTIVSYGGHTAFKFTDPMKYSVTDESLGTGDGSRTKFYTDNPYVKNSSLVVKVDGVTQTLNTDYTVSDPMEDGLITFQAGSEPGVGAAVTATYEYYRKVRFDIKDPTRELQIRAISGSGTTTVWELRVPVEEILV